MTFDCKCEACENDYPLLDNLPRAPISRPSKIIKSSESITRSIAIKFHKKLAKFIEKLDKHRCSEDWVVCREAFTYYVGVMFEKEEIDFLHKSENYIKFKENREATVPEFFNW